MADNNTNSSIMDKLDYLETTKTQIREALISKGQSVSTIDTFRSYVEAINDIQVGTDTSDADATAYDIIAPRTAYAKDKKLVGKINKITNEFSFDNYELSQTNAQNNLIKDYTMKDNQIFHQEYFEGMDLIGKDVLIYMRPNADESQAIVFTYNNTNTLKVNITNNTMILKTYDVNNTETNTLTTYTDLFLSGTPTKTNGPYSGTYFGNDSYFTTKNIYDSNNDILFEADENQSYTYFTINQSFDETKAISSEANNKINLKQKDLAEIAGLRPEILKENETIMGITGSMEPKGNYQTKNLEYLANGTYEVRPDQGYDAITSLNIRVKSVVGDQHMTYYSIEQEDDGSLYCRNNYDEIPWWPYEIDRDGNFIVNQDDDDTAVYIINENMELEVQI